MRNIDDDFVFGLVKKRGMGILNGGLLLFCFNYKVLHIY